MTQQEPSDGSVKVSSLSSRLWPKFNALSSMIFRREQRRWIRNLAVLPDSLSSKLDLAVAFDVVHVPHFGALEEQERTTLETQG